MMSMNRFPFTLNLSNWAATELTIKQWLQDRMNGEYGIAVRMTQQWLAKGKLTLLLDGLDEVAQERRSRCVDAINLFLRQHQLSVVICSRTKDYELLESKLNLAQAVEIQPLTDAQIESYLTDTRLALVGVHQMVLEDDALAELAQNTFDAIIYGTGLSWL